MEEKKNFIMNTCYYTLKIIIFLVLGYGIFRYGFILIISFFLALLVKPFSDCIVHLFNIKNKLLKNIIIVLTMIIFYLLMIFLVCAVILMMIHVLGFLPQYLEKIYTQFVNNQFFMTIIDTLYQNLRSAIENILISSINQIVSLLIDITSLLFHVFLCFIFSVFFLVDYDFFAHHSFLKSKYGMVAYRTIHNVKEILHTLLKTYIILFFVTFVILWVSFCFIHLEHAFLIAFMIALFDFFPILGIDMIMIPWIIILALFNQIPMALSILFIYGIIIVVKNILEPKLLSHAVGVKPIIMLIAMFLATKICGFMGMLIAPFVVFLIQIYIREKEIE